MSRAELEDKIKQMERQMERNDSALAGMKKDLSSLSRELGEGRSFCYKATIKKKIDRILNNR
jgi:phage shock protein A